MMGQSETHWLIVRSYLLHSLLQMDSVAVPFTRHPKMCLSLAEPKECCSWPKPACFDFSSSNFTLQNHILSTAGDALSGGWIGRPCTTALHALQVPIWCRILGIKFWLQLNGICVSDIWSTMCAYVMDGHVPYKCMHLDENYYIQ